MFRSVLASQAGDGQQGASAQGLNRMGAGFRGGSGQVESIEGPPVSGAVPQANKPRGVSNRVRCQAILGFQGVLDLSMAFMMLSSLCMQATITTLAGFPAALRL
jgi:hypothetical protein